MTNAENVRKENVRTLNQKNTSTTPSHRLAGLLARLWRKHGRRGETGAEVVEFALSASVFFLFCFGFMELCLVLFTLNSVSEAARDAARWASVRGTSSSETVNGATNCVNPNITGCPATENDIQTYVQSLPGTTSATVTANWCDSDGASNCSASESNAIPGHIIKVTVSYSFASVPFFRSASLTLNSTAEKVVWQ